VTHYSFVRSFFRSFVHSFIQSVIQSVIHSQFHSFTNFILTLFIHSKDSHSVKLLRMCPLQTLHTRNNSISSVSLIFKHRVFQMCVFYKRCTRSEYLHVKEDAELKEGCATRGNFQIAVNIKHLFKDEENYNKYSKYASSAIYGFPTQFLITASDAVSTDIIVNVIIVVIIIIIVIIISPFFSLCLSVYLTVYLALSLCLCRPLSPCLSLSLFICLSLFLPSKSTVNRL